MFSQLVNLGVIVYLTQLLEVNPFYKKVTLKNMTLTVLLHFSNTNTLHTKDAHRRARARAHVHADAKGRSHLTLLLDVVVSFLSLSTWAWSFIWHSCSRLPHSTKSHPSKYDTNLSTRCFPFVRVSPNITLTFLLRFFWQLVNLGVIVYLTQLLEINPFYKKSPFKIWH